MRITVKSLTLYKQLEIMLDRKKIKFTGRELSNMGFSMVVDGKELYYIYTNRYFPHEVNFLITSDGCEEDEYTVDYGYTSKFGKRQRSLTKLDEELIQLFIKDMNIYVSMEEWFEKLICRE